MVEVFRMCCSADHVRSLMKKTNDSAHVCRSVHCTVVYSVFHSFAPELHPNPVVCAFIFFNSTNFFLHYSIAASQHSIELWSANEWIFSTHEFSISWAFSDISVDLFSLHAYRQMHTGVMGSYPPRVGRGFKSYFFSFVVNAAELLCVICKTIITADSSWIF